MKKVISICVFFLATNLIAQQAPLYDQYYLNPYLYNPAYAGKNFGNVFLLHKNQWTAFEGAPTYNVFTIDGSIKEKIGLGLNISNETKGISSKIDAQVTYAYRIEFSDENNLRLGASFGMLNKKTDFSKTILNNPADPVLPIEAQSISAITAAAGAALQAGDFYVDISMPQLLGNSIAYSSPSSKTPSHLARQFIASVKYEIPLLKKKDVFLTPLLMANYTPGTPFQYDLNLIAEWNDVFWAGAAYKSSYAIAGMTGLKFSDIRLGYAYELPVNAIKSYSGAGHEIAIAYTFYSKKGKQGKLPSSKIKRIEQKLYAMRGELKKQEMNLKRKEKDVIRMIDRYYIRIKKGMKAESPESLRQRKAIEDVLAEENAIRKKIEKINKQIDLKSDQLENQ